MLKTATSKTKYAHLHTKTSLTTTLSATLKDAINIEQKFKTATSKTADTAYENITNNNAKCNAENCNIKNGRYVSAHENITNNNAKKQH